MTPNARSANSAAVGSSLTNRLNGPPDPVDAAVAVAAPESAGADPSWSFCDEDPAVAPAVPADVCPDDPDARRPPAPATGPPVARRVVPTLARVPVPVAEPPTTDGAADPEVGAAEAVDAEADAPRDGSSGRLPTGVLTVGVRTGLVGSDGVVRAGVVRLGVLTCGVVTGPTVTGGTVTEGTLTVGKLTVGVVPVGTLTVGTLTVGTLIDGTEAVGSDAACPDPTAMAITPHVAAAASAKAPASLFATRVEIEHRLRTGPSTHDRKTAS